MQDDTRSWRTAAERDIWKAGKKDISAYFCGINRNKRSMTLNLKQEKGREILFRLIERADIVCVYSRIPIYSFWILQFLPFPELIISFREKWMKWELDMRNFAVSTLQSSMLVYLVRYLKPIIDFELSVL